MSAPAQRSRQEAVQTSSISRDATALLAGTVADTTVACHRLGDAQDALEQELQKLTSTLQRYLESSPEPLASTIADLEKAQKRLVILRTKLKAIEARLKPLAK